MAYRALDSKTPNARGRIRRPYASMNTRSAPPPYPEHAMGYTASSSASANSFVGSQQHNKLPFQPVPHATPVFGDFVVAENPRNPRSNKDSSFASFDGTPGRVRNPSHQPDPQYMYAGGVQPFHGNWNDHTMGFNQAPINPVYPYMQSGTWVPVSIPGVFPYGHSMPVSYHSGNSNSVMPCDGTAVGVVPPYSGEAFSVHTGKPVHSSSNVATPPSEQPPRTESTAMNVNVGLDLLLEAIEKVCFMFTIYNI